METRYLKTLVAVVEEGSFSRAAETLHITQSAVSQRIKFLEEYFGHRLFERSATGLVLTQAGQVVLTKSRDILGKEREMVDSLKGLGRTQRLALSCTPTFGMAYLPRVLNEFLRAHADIADLKFVFAQPDEALRGLRNEDYDLAVVEHCPEQDFSGLDRFALPDDELLLVGPPGFVPISADGTADLAAMRRFRLFARREGCSSRQMLEQNLQRKGCSLGDFDGLLVSDDLRLTIQSILDGEGVAFISRALVEQHLKVGNLVGCHVGGFDHRRGRSVALLPGRQSDPLLQDLIECIFATVSPEWRPQQVFGLSAG